jgi:acyl-[acyl-carrier-protein]-phospholipid O-acyltransferase/long-chain-fatty-acid--[acyl-carrier-protein] ligase
MQGESHGTGIGARAIVRKLTIDQGENLMLALQTVLLAIGLAVTALLVLFWFRPVLLVRIPVWLLTHTIYRIRVMGADHVPATGPALLVCNHVSYFDWLFLLAAQKRFIHFVIFAGWTRRFGLRHILKWAGVIPIDKSAGPRAIVQSLRSASEALAQGEVVCIFAEGRFTRTGFLLPFHRGFEQIAKHSPAPIIPVCLEHLWGSIFSYRSGKLIWKWPQVLPYPLTAAFGPALPPTTTAVQVRLAIQKLSADGAMARKHPLVHRQFARMASLHPFRSCIIDPAVRQKPFSYGEMLAGAMCIARQLRPVLADDAMVGLWMPSGFGGVITNIALALLGKTSVNLNYTAGPDNVQSAMRQGNLRHVITAKRFVDLLPLKTGPETTLLYLEEINTRITSGQKVRAFLKVLLLPRFVLSRWVLGLAGHKPDDLATVIFSSGSTGDPKGVMLSHRNIAANADSMIQAIDARSRDRILGVLPLFHSFGFTVTMWVPLQVGASIVYHPDPRQGRQIGALCRKFQCTFYLTTPTFLRFCLKRCEAEDFKSLRLLMCGAEKLAADLAKQFQEKFSVLPMSGYGCTELSPAAISNVPDQEMDGFRQIGNKPGTIGQPIPGVAARVVDPETFQDLPPGKEGLLLVYGPNVMMGYLGKPELTKEAIRDGWYVTGDLVHYDEDGFITITDRLSRFSKIGGEMVPHGKIEEALQAILGGEERKCVVTSVPDASKGERLVVLHLPLDGVSPAELRKKLEEKDLPNLWLPREKDLFAVNEIPLLGSGKLDLKKCKEIAQKLAGVE